MVHGMDAMCARYRDDPVRAALEKKKNREMSAMVREDGARRANELLKTKLEAAGKSFDGMDNSVEGALDDDAAYKRELDKQVTPRFEPWTRALGLTARPALLALATALTPGFEPHRRSARS